MNQTSDLKQGDKVRTDDTRLFKKGTENRWSDEIFNVESAKGKSVTLTNGQVLKREKVLKIPSNTVPITHTNIMKLATKERKQVLQLRAEGIKQENIISTKREKIGNKQLSDFVLNKPTKKDIKQDDIINTKREKVANKQLKDFVLKKTTKNRKI